MEERGDRSSEEKSNLKETQATNHRDGAGCLHRQGLLPTASQQERPNTRTSRGGAEPTKFLGGVRYRLPDSKKGTSASPRDVLLACGRGKQESSPQPG